MWLVFTVLCKWSGFEPWLRFIYFITLFRFAYLLRYSTKIKQRPPLIFITTVTCRPYITKYPATSFHIMWFILQNVRHEIMIIFYSNNLTEGAHSLKAWWLALGFLTIAFEIIRFSCFYTTYGKTINWNWTETENTLVFLNCFTYQSFCLESTYFNQCAVKWSAQWPQTKALVKASICKV